MTCRCGRKARERESGCPSCGEGRAGAAPWPVRLLARALAWTAAAFALRGLFKGGWLIRLAKSGFVFVFGCDPASVAESAVTAVAILGTLALMAEMAVGDRVPVFAPFARIVGKAIVFLPRVAWMACRIVFLAVEGKPISSADRKGDKPRGGN